MVLEHLGSARPRDRTRPDGLRRWRSGQGDGGGGGGEQITVASDIAYPPFEFEKNGKPVGFDIDLMREIGKRAGFTPEFQNVTFDGIIPGLGNNLYDAGASAFTITEAREKKVDFSDPYFNADQSLMVQSGSPIKSVDDIGDGTVGVQLGTTGELKAKEFEQQGKITGEVRTYDTITEAFSALENGQIEAVINDFPVSAYFAKTGGGSLEVVQTHPDRRAVRYSLPPGQRSPRAHQQGARGDKEGRHLRRDIREVARREAQGDAVG